MNKNGQVAPVNFREAHRVLLGGDDRVRLALLAAVDDVQHFLLAEPVMVGEAFGINQFTAERGETALKAFRLRDAAERGDFFSREQFEAVPLAGEHVLEIERVMHALNDAGRGIVLRDALAKRSGVAVAFGDEDGAGRAKCDGGSRNVPRGSICSLPKGCW